MLQKLLMGVLVFVACGAIGFLGLVGCIYYNEHTIRQNLAKNIEISPEWTDIPIDPPVTPIRMSQHIFIYVDGMSATIDRNGVYMKLKDGSDVKPQIEMVDESGTVYPMDSWSLLNSDPGVAFRNELDDEIAGKRFKTLRIRSDIPFKASKLEWMDMHLK